MANKEYISGTEAPHIGTFAPPKLNAARLGGEYATDQRLSGLASDAEHRARSGQQRGEAECI